MELDVQGSLSYKCTAERDAEYAAQTWNFEQVVLSVLGRTRAEVVLVTILVEVCIDLTFPVQWRAGILLRLEGELAVL